MSKAEKLRTSKAPQRELSSIRSCQRVLWLHRRWQGGLWKKGVAGQYLNLCVIVADSHIETVDLLYVLMV